MKQVGLNVASDPLMSLAYIGVKGGMVVLVADDPGPISSQTEQDTRTFAQYSKLPVFDPATPEEAYYMIGEAFDYSEKYGTPVLFRPTTRVCHACAVIDTDDVRRAVPAGHFEKDPRWVIFPKLSLQAHARIEKRNPEIARDFSTYSRNAVEAYGADGAHAKRVIVTGGVNAMYVQEALHALGDPDTRVLKVATPFPFPEELAEAFLADAEEVLCVEELDPVLERALLMLCGKRHLAVTVRGKLTGDVQAAGENTNESVRAVLAGYFGIALPEAADELPEPPALPVRPPVLCAGCPHVGLFYELGKMKNVIAIGDIGCYALSGNPPLNAKDFALCMGAGFSMAHGAAKIMEKFGDDTRIVGVVGDSTFFHTGMNSMLDAAYNGSNVTLIVVDNRITGMTGHQENPGSGYRITGEHAYPADIEGVARAFGITDIHKVNPMDLKATREALKAALDFKGPSLVITRWPCVLKRRTPEDAAEFSIDRTPYAVDHGACIGCRSCMHLGCPALSFDSEAKKANIDPTACAGCGVCSQVCPKRAIGKVGA